MDKDYLNKKWLSGDLTEKERKAFEQIEDNELLKLIVDKAPAFSASHLSDVKDYDALKARMQTEKRFNKKRRWITPMLRIASVLVIAFGIYFTLVHGNSITVESTIGEKKMVELPDNSEVTLNAVSEITYSEKTWDDKRELTLDGEAFFKVAKGSTFDVITAIGKVSVVGTKFNVKNRKDLFEVDCFEGRVNVTYGDEITSLLPGNVYRVTNGKISSDTISDRNEPFWLDNMSYFKKALFHEVIAELERQYGIKVTIDPNDKNLLFTGGFAHNNLKEALEAITVPMKLTYTMETSINVSLHHSE